MVLMACSQELLKVSRVRVTLARCCFTSGKRKIQLVRNLVSKSGEEALLSDAHPLLLLLLGEKLWDTSCWLLGEAQILVKYGEDGVNEALSHLGKGAWSSPSGHPQWWQKQRPLGVCFDGFLGIESPLLYWNGTGSRKWPAKMPFPEQSVDQTSKSI
jgi:hypothetical protein